MSFNGSTNLSLAGTSAHIYWDLKGIRNATVFVGTEEILYPDITKFFGMIDEDPSNELIIGEEMNHVYPLFPIPEAKPAVDKIIHTIQSL